MEIDILHILDILGTIAFAVSGVLAAMEKKLDLFGILIIAFVTAIGGGTLRDLLIGAQPVAWIEDITYTFTIVLTVAITIPFNRPIGNSKKTLLIFDSLGLGIFTIVGVEKGLVFHLHPAMCVVLGTITACFGGVIRDILLNNIPIIFRKKIYASACIIGAALYLLSSQFLALSSAVSEIICISVIILIRIGAVYFGWHLPYIYRRSPRKQKRT